jgi:hypothetical protein
VRKRLLASPSYSQDLFKTSSSLKFVPRRIKDGAADFEHAEYPSAHDGICLESLDRYPEVAEWSANNNDEPPAHEKFRSDRHSALRVHRTRLANKVSTTVGALAARTARRILEHIREQTS